MALRINTHASSSPRYHTCLMAEKTATHEARRTRPLESTHTVSSPHLAAAVALTRRIPPRPNPSLFPYSPGVMDTAPRHSPADGGPLHLHVGSAVQGAARGRLRRLDPEDKLRAGKAI